MKSETWIKMYRKFTDWEWFDSSNMVHLMIYILLKTNFTDKKWQGINIKAGSFVTSLGKLSNATGISKQKLRTCLDKLELTQEIKVTTTTKYTMIVVLNWKSYQIKDGEPTHQPEHQITYDQQTNNIRSTTTKKGKKEENDKEYSFNAKTWWNSFASKAGTKPVRSVNGSRLQKVKARSLDKHQDEAKDQLLNLARFVFEGDSQWMDFDWIIKNDVNFTKLLEGKYRKQDAPADEEPEYSQDEIMKLLSGDEEYDQ